MEIKVLGTGCANCRALYSAVEQVVNELGLKSRFSERGGFDENNGI